MSQQQDESERQERGDLFYELLKKGKEERTSEISFLFSGIYFPLSRNLRARISFFLALISLFWQAWVSFEPEEAGREKWECWFLFPALFTSFDVYYTTVNEGAYQNPTPASNELWVWAEFGGEVEEAVVKGTTQEGSINILFAFLVWIFAHH